MAEEQQARVVPVGPQALAPHRGVAVLVLGIIGLVFTLPAFACCAVFIIVPLVCGIIAWIMGKKDLKEMAAGIMDPSGEGMTKAGKICGIISVILAIVLTAVQLIILLIVLVIPLITETNRIT